MNDFIKKNFYSDKFLRAINIALIVNFIMFIIEIICGFYANSLALILDSTDFLGDSLNYGIAIFVFTKPKKWQSISALIKASFMLAFGIYIIINAIYRFINIENDLEHLPNGNIMMVMSLFALIANFAVSWLLFQFRDGNSNQQSVWLCSRNDAINNLITIIAGFLTLYYHSKIPDLAVALIMSILATSSAIKIFHQVKKELKNY